METVLDLKYSGSAVDSGRMDVYDAAANMIAFSDFAVLCGKQAYGDRAEVRADVTGFQRGSFVTTLMIHASGVIAPLLGTVSANDVLSVMKDSVALWKHLRGDPPSSMEQVDGNRMKIANNHGTIFIVSGSAASVVFSEKGANSVDRCVKQALGKDGIDSVDIVHGDDAIAVVTKDESLWFTAVEPQQMLSDYTIQCALSIESLAFKDGHKWRLNDGSSSFYATIEDQKFIATIDAGEPFAKGDTLMVSMQVKQREKGGKIVAEKSIIEVSKHLRRSAQGVLPNI